MKKNIFNVLAILSFWTTSEAVLPPLYSTLHEYRALLEDNQLENKLDSGQAILSIDHVNEGFIILTPKYSLKVDVVYLPQDQPGPSKFQLVFHDLELRG